MHKCPNCGAEVHDDDKVCPNCGHDLLKRQSRNNQNKASNTNVRKIIPWGIAFFIIVLIVIIFFLLKNFNSPESQSELLINAIDNNDTQKLSTVLSTQNNNVDEDEAKAYIKYIKNEIGMKNFTKDVRAKIASLNENDAQLSKYVTARNGEKILKVTKNGRRYLIFSNMNFTAPTKEAIVKPKFDAKYKFRSNDKQRTIEAPKGQTTSLGKFIPGDYSIDAKRTTQNGQFSGKLNFNFNNSNNETVDVAENFDEAYLRINLSGADKLDDNSIKLKINDKLYDYEDSKSYGPYPKNEQIKVSANGEAKKRTFKSSETTIQPDSLKDNTNVKVPFDKDKINDYVKKKEKEENSFRSKITNFFNTYTTALNTAYGQNNFDIVSNYLKKGSSNYKSTKSDISSQSYSVMQVPQISEIIKVGNKFYVDGYGIKKNGQYGEVKYTLEGNDSGNDLKVTNYSE